MGEVEEEVEGMTLALATFPPDLNHQFEASNQCSVNYSRGKIGSKVHLKCVQPFF